MNAVFRGRRDEWSVGRGLVVLGADFCGHWGPTEVPGHRWMNPEAAAKGLIFLACCRSAMSSRNRSL